MFILLGKKYLNKSIEIVQNEFDIIWNLDVIKERLKGITRFIYFADVVNPFLCDMPTKFKIPRWKKHFLPFNLCHLLGKFNKYARNLKYGDFVYVGCKEEVYLLGLAKESNGLYKQGTYTTSTKPMFYFSNNYLHFVSSREKERVAVFDNIPFIYPQMGRTQDCKNKIFTGEPDIITGDLNEALNHFKNTDFVEFIDIVEKYAKTMNYICPFIERNGKYFY